MNARNEKWRNPPTWEPKTLRQNAPVADAPRFVIQLHHATAVHYDFRLEAAGVLKSWAVPKGPSTDPRIKRLAVEVADHGLGHIDYENDQTGRGSVRIWDRGTYRSLTEGPVEDAIANGHLSFWLEGERLRGGWTLQRTSDGEKPQWILVKRRDEEADT
jgi:DNA ligase D-like protein (predicted 3'-phosphoesterase)